MNLSPRIDPVKCRTCGDCCKNFRIFYPGGLPRLKYDEMIRVVYSQGINATIEETEGGHWLILNHPCRYLEVDLATGEYSCMIYDHPARPSICALFPYTISEPGDCPHMQPVVEKQV